MTYEEMRRYVPGTITKDMLRAVHEVLPHYIFKTVVGKKRFGYCTFCKHEYHMQTSPVHNAKAICPHCGHECRMKDAGRGRKNMVDEVYITYYKRAAGRHDAIAALGLLVRMDYSADFKAEVKASAESMCLFEYGKGATRYDSAYRWSADENERGYKWRQVCEIGVPGVHKSIWRIIKRYDQISIRHAIKGTPFARVDWTKYKDDDDAYLHYFEMLSRWPSVEYLHKLGYSALIQERLDRNTYSYNSVNWRGKDLTSVLRLDMQTIRAAKGIGLDFGTLHVLQKANKQGDRSITPQVAHNITNDMGGWLGEFIKMQDKIRISKKYAYFKKQGKYPHASFADWKDYVRWCGELGMNLEDEAVLFPKDLKAAHDRRQKEYQALQKRRQQMSDAQRDKALTKKFDERYAALTKEYTFEHAGFFLRPARSAAELRKEGNALHHCVGMYADRHASGATIICFIRRAGQPDKPFYTVEFRPKDGKVMQCRGKNNAVATTEVNAFMEAFEASKTTKRRETA